MDLQYETDNTFKSLDNIKIPDIFFNRYKTGISIIDDLFQDGILPGSTITLSAPPGAGKTSLLLQILSSMNNNGYKTGYASGEEDLFQIAFTVERLKAKGINAGNISDVDVLAQKMEDLDILVIDSFQALTTKNQLNSRELERYAISTITKSAKKNKCVVFIIMHRTKMGTMKGGTIVPHTVDVNMEIDIIENEEGVFRKIFFTKNRFGPCNDICLLMGSEGYMFDEPVDMSTVDIAAKENKKKSNKDQLFFEIEQYIQSELIVDTQGVMDKLNLGYMKAYNLLREMSLNGTIVKSGKGKTATYSK